MGKLLDARKRFREARTKADKSRTYDQKQFERACQRELDGEED